MEKKDCLSHHEVLTRLDGYDAERGVKIAGHRGYCLTGYGLFLNLALVNYGLEFLFTKGYKPNQPPYFMLRDYMAKTAQLEQFDEELYKVVEGENSADKYLIATSEQPISAMHDSEWMQEKDLPIKLGDLVSQPQRGIADTLSGTLVTARAFEKRQVSMVKTPGASFASINSKRYVIRYASEPIMLIPPAQIEQFLFTKPEDSWQAFDDMIAVSEEFYQSLGIPYQIVAIVSGALNNAAAKKYDLEAWFPFQGEYKELVSCSNCTDYQSRELEIRYGVKKGEIDTRKTYVHALNATLCATERALCCILENYQTPEVGSLCVSHLCRR